MRSTLAMSFVALLAFAGCGAKDQQTTAATNNESSTKTEASANLTPEELGELGAQIRKTPDRANEILRERGLTEKTFETEIREVTEDPEASKRYAAAYKKASA
ncbi:MAG: hypothetical protein ACXW31_16050, partial [Thermoanaerobaculia bacterium]